MGDVVDHSLLIHHDPVVHAELQMTSAEVIRSNLAAAAHPEVRAAAAKGRPEIELILTVYGRAEMPREWYGSELRRLDAEGGAVDFLSTLVSC